MRVLVCGGRDFSDQQFLYKIMDNLHKYYMITSVVEGDARGADRIAGQWAKRNRIDLYPVKAEWDKYGKKAGYLRNKRMLDEYSPDMVVAFPGGAGTQMMIDLANEAGVEVLEVE